MTAFPVPLACPECRAPLDASRPGERRCIREGSRYLREEGIWRFLLPETRRRLGRFLAEYSEIRRREGRGDSAPEHYRALPLRDTTGRFRGEWRIRARSYRALLSRVVEPLEARRERPLRILDLGAGNGWLSHRLARRDHAVAAVDLSDDPRDGLGAHRHYRGTGAESGHPFHSFQADFDRLPFGAGAADLVVYNASFHYSTDYVRTLREALRVLASGGRIVVMDTPLYRDPESGRAMLREQEAGFTERFGFPSDALPREGFLTRTRLPELGEAVGLSWRTEVPFYGIRWALRPWVARLRGAREPATFALLVGTDGKRGREVP